MPIHLGREEGKWFYQYGQHGTKYYFKKIGGKSEDNAYDKALLQLKAMMASKKKYHV